VSRHDERFFWKGIGNRGPMCFEAAGLVTCSPYDLYARLDLGPGGYASAPSTETRRGRDNGASTVGPYERT
jgi:hypothetical protein